MTPKEKAEELFDKMYNAIPSDDYGTDYDSAKQCALIAIDTILDGNNIIFNKKYYDEVKQEIEKL